MLQVYSNNITITIPADTVVFVPFNNVSKDKGCDSFLSSPGTTQINRQGVYDVHVNASLAPETEGDYIMQLYVNGVAQPESLTRFTAVADEYSNISFEDLVTVARNNTNCCYSSPTSLQIGISGVDGITGDIAVANISELVTRLC